VRHGVPRGLPHVEPPLADELVTVREWRREDMAAMTAMLNEPAIVRWTRVPSPYREADAIEFLTRGEAERIRGEGINLGIFDSATDELLGSITLRIASWADLRGQLGYLVGEHARGRGACPAAIRLLTRWGFERIGLERIEILVHPDNPSSQRVAEKAGFRREGVLRSYTRVKTERFDMWSFSMLPGEIA
jgi:RimJ/RimL family protein N-acetyltransferase